MNTGKKTNGKKTALSEAGRLTELEKAVERIENAYLASSRFSLMDLSSKVLEAAKNCTGSPCGFAAYIDAHTGWMVAPTLSRGVCRARLSPGKPLVFREFTGLWGWVLKNKKPLLTNSASSDPRSSGVPDGHIRIEKFLAAPAVFNGGLTGIIAVANPDRDYSAGDLAAVKRLARLYAIILQRKMAEERVRESEAKYASIINNSSDIIYTVNPDGRLTYASDSVRAGGYTPEEIIGRHIMEFIHPDDRYGIKQVFAKALRSGRTPSMISCRLRKKDGSYFRAEQKSGAIKKDGRLLMFSGIIRDVSERDELRSRAAKTEELIRMVFDNATDAIFVKDLKLRYVQANRASAAIIGLRPEKMAGKTDYDIFPAAIAAAIQREDRQVIRTGRNLTVNKEMPCRGGVRFAHIVKTPLKDGNGAVIGVLGISRDITELKKLEAELVRAKAVEAVNRIARPAAHDFNNILSAINGYATLMMETMKTGDPVRPEIAQILGAVKRAAAITERLQTYDGGTIKR